MNTEFHNEKGWPPCALSLDHANLLAADYKIHHAPEAELRTHHGICAKCAAKIKKANLGVLAGKTETPAEWSKLHDLVIRPEDHIAHDDGEIVGTCDFAWHELDEVLAKTSPEARIEAVEALGAIFRLVYPKGAKTPLRSAAAKLATLVSGIDPQLLGGKTLADMGRELGRTKAALCKQSVQMQSKLGIKFARSRSDEGRKRMAARRTGGPDRHRKEATHDAYTPS